jgi:serine beta-lactamase-like protein LACTB
VAGKLAGRYRSGEKTIDLIARGGKLWVLPGRGGFRSGLRSLGSDLIVDDVLDHGLKLTPEGDKLRVGKDIYERVAVERPEPCPTKWLGLIGEYGWDHDVLYILEKDGKLHALIEWFFIYPLSEESENVYKFPDFGLYHDEKLVFKRDAKGKATEVEAANVVFKRRHLDGEDGRTFKIEPRRSIADIRREALAATPPPETGEFAKPDLVELVKLDDSIKLDVRYATTNNFLSTPFYQSAKAYLQRPAAEALVRVHRKLADRGFGLLIHDGYRPWNVTKMFWEATPDAQRIFVADPSKGSRHNRGCAVDLTLYDRKTGKPIEMVGGYDEMSDRSYPEYLGGTSLQRWHRDLLRTAMEAAGFTVYEAEWWHFDYKDWKRYAILNRTLEELEKKPAR